MAKGIRESKRLKVPKKGQVISLGERQRRLLEDHLKVQAINRISHAKFSEPQRKEAIGMLMRYCKGKDSLFVKRMAVVTLGHLNAETELEWLKIHARELEVRKEAQDILSHMKGHTKGMQAIRALKAAFGR